MVFGFGRMGWCGVGLYCGILLNLMEDYLRIVLKYKEKMVNGMIFFVFNYVIIFVKIDIFIIIVILIYSSKCYVYILFN